MMDVNLRCIKCNSDEVGFERVHEEFDEHLVRLKGKCNNCGKENLTKYTSNSILNLIKRIKDNRNDWSISTKEAIERHEELERELLLEQEIFEEYYSKLKL